MGDDITPMSKFVLEDHADRLRDLERVPAQVSALEARVEAGFEAMTLGFEKIENSIGTLQTLVTDINTRITSLEGTRKRGTAILKWAGGVATALVTLALALVLGLK